MERPYSPPTKGEVTRLEGTRKSCAIGTSAKGAVHVGPQRKHLKEVQVLHRQKSCAFGSRCPLNYPHPWIARYVHDASEPVDEKAIQLTLEVCHQLVNGPHV